jgi:glycosyltransferase involved in cell wall biosynthesis
MITLITTAGKGAIDSYGAKLSHQLDVPSLCIGLREPFDIPLFSLESISSFKRDWRVIKTLSQQKILHLTHHHLGRYMNFVKVPCIITVHDLIRQFDRLGFPPLIHKPNLRDKLYLWLDREGIRKAKYIIAISQQTKKDLISFLGIPEERIRVIYNGVDHDIFKPCPAPKPVDEPYILYVGSEQPRKNLTTLLMAFHKLKADKSFRELKLVKVGEAGGKNQVFRQQSLKLIESLNLRGDIVFTGFVAEEEMAGYYSNAECLVFPSLYEGFGLPVIEAMACGCPVITSNTSSLPEIVGEAGIMVEPHDAEGLANAVGEVFTNPDLKQELKKRGLERASNFSWEKTAEETMKVYEQVESIWLR